MRVNRNIGERGFAALAAAVREGAAPALKAFSFDNEKSASAPLDCARRARAKARGLASRVGSVAIFKLF